MAYEMVECGFNKRFCSDMNFIKKNMIMLLDYTYDETVCNTCNWPSYFIYMMTANLGKTERERESFHLNKNFMWAQNCLYYRFEGMSLLQSFHFAQGALFY